MYSPRLHVGIARGLVLGLLLSFSYVSVPEDLIPSPGFLMDTDSCTSTVRPDFFTNLNLYIQLPTLV